MRSRRRRQREEDVFSSLSDIGLDSEPGSRIAGDHRKAIDAGSGANAETCWQYSVRAVAHSYKAQVDPAAPVTS
jgi:hypothetical protein